MYWLNILKSPQFDEINIVWSQTGSMQTGLTQEMSKWKDLDLKGNLINVNFKWGNWIPFWIHNKFIWSSLLFKHIIEMTVLRGITVTSESKLFVSY